MFTTCKKAAINEINNLNQNKIYVLGHAGSGLNAFTNPYPPDSKLAIEHAIKGLNANGSEMDVRIDLNGVLWLYHDFKLQSQTNCFGCIEGMSTEDIEKCIYKSTVATSLNKKDTIARLDAIFETYSTSTFFPVLSLDCKVGNICDATQMTDLNLFANQLVSLIKTYNVYSKVVVESPSLDLLKMVKAIDSKVIVFYNNSDVDAAKPIILNNAFEGLIIYNNSITKEQADDLHANNIQISIYGVKIRSGSVEAVAKSPEMIQTDNIVLLQEILKE